MITSCMTACTVRLSYYELLTLNFIKFSFKLAEVFRKAEDVSLNTLI
jgi:hypothetical protein